MSNAIKFFNPATNSWQLIGWGSGGIEIPTTNAILKGDGVGGIITATLNQDYINLNYLQEALNYKVDKTTYNPISKTEEMTQSVGVDNQGHLYTKPSSSNMLAVDDGEGNIIITGSVAATDDGEGNITFIWR